MLSIALSRPNNAYSQMLPHHYGGAVSGGGNVYALEEYCSNRDFSGTTSPWAFVYDQDVVQNPLSTAEVSYDEAKTGVSSARVTFNSSTEWFAINISSSTDKGAKISAKQLKISFYIKTTSSSLNVLVIIPGLFSEATPITQASGQWSQVNVTSSMPVMSEQYKIFVGIFSSTGTGTAYIDDFSITVDGNNTEVVDYSFVTFSPTFYHAALSGASRPQEYILVFTSGANRNISSRIQSVVLSNGLISRINLTDALPYLPVAGDRVSILSPSSIYGDTATAVINRGVVSCSVDTDIQEGYFSASVSIMLSEIERVIGSSDFLLWRITVYNEHGEIFDGVITSIEENSGVVQFTASGFHFFLTATRYIGYFDSSPNVTIKTVLDDMLKWVKAVRYSPVDIDRDSSISSAQTLIGGIGPLDFTDGQKTIKDAINQILSFGTFDDTNDSLFLQIYSGARPVLKRVNRKISTQDIMYAISKRNLSGNSVSWSTSISEMYNSMYGVYSGRSGRQGETASVVDLPSVVRYGIIEKNVSSGSLSEYEIYLVLQNEVASVKNLGAVGEISVIGMIDSYRSRDKVHVSRIRSGDVVWLSGVYSSYFGRPSGSDDWSVIVVGHTSYDALSGEMKITPFGQESTVEAMINMLEVA